MVTGIVRILNHQRGMYGVQLPNGSYSVFELLDTVEINALDQIQGALEDVGSCVLLNRTLNEQFDAIVQNIVLNEQQAKQRSFLQN